MRFLFCLGIFLILSAPVTVVIADSSNYGNEVAFGLAGIAAGLATLLPGRFAARSMLATTTVARISYSVVLVAIVAVGASYEHGWILAGGLAAAATAGMGLSAMAKGRLIDGPGPGTLLLAEGLLSLLALLMLGAVLFFALPPLLLLPISFLLGVGDPSTVVISKNVWWKNLEDERDRLAAMALDQTASGLSYSLGTALAGLLLLWIGAWPALLLGVFGSAVVAFILRKNILISSWQSSKEVIRKTGLVRFLPVTIIYLSYFSVSGAMPVLVLAADPGSLTPLVLAAIYPGTMISGLIYGIRTGRSPVRALRLSLLLGALALTLGAGLVHLALGILGLALILYGFTRGPVPAASSFVAFRIAGEGAGGQATGILSTALFAGLGLGAFLGGVAVDLLGPVDALWLFPGLIVPALAASLFLHHSVRPASELPGKPLLSD